LTPIGFVDTTSNLNITRQIWLQAGVDITFLPIKRYNNSNYQNLTVSCTKSSCDSTSPNGGLQELSLGNPTFPTPMPPLAPASANAINVFFVNALTAGNTNTPSPIYGFGWLNGNGIAIAANTFYPTARLDTLAHEIGHALNADHTTFGAGSTNTSGTPDGGPVNVMTAGGYRMTPTSSGNLSMPAPGGALYALANGLADQLTLSSEENTKLKTSQQTESLLSGFLNPSYNSLATAGGGLQAAASLAASTGTTSASSSSAPITFTVEFPPSLTGSNGRPGAFIANLVVTPPGTFNIVSNSFFVFPPPDSTINATAVTAALLHGNNGIGNLRCAKPLISGPNDECLVVTIAPNTFTVGNRLVFSVQINNGSTPIMLAQLAGTEFTWVFETDQTDSSGNTVVAERFATTSVFPGGGASTVNSGFPDGTQPALILNPDTFVGFTDIACTPNAGGQCPKAIGGNWAKTLAVQSEP
jgi:hypothetical protein